MPQSFSDKLLRWFDRHGRHGLPWQKDSSPYRVWVSEIMLQQTQVGTVIPYFLRFMATFPDVHALAAAEVDQVLHLWTGLGYYARARNLHRCAQAIVTHHGGSFPESVEALAALPGIGRSTAGAIVAIAHGGRAPILDGNVKRVLARHFAIDGWPEQAAVRNRLWELADSLTPAHRVADYTQAIMDLGATVCSRGRPDCDRCPLTGSCLALAKDATSRYPGRKPARELPVRTVVMHILQASDGSVLLERRPPAGIWGGLWSFPESAPEAALPAQVCEHLIVTAGSDLSPFRHTFSHFHLDILPRQARVTPRHGMIMDSARWLWYPLDRTAQVGLAAPVRKLLGQLAQQADSNPVETGAER